MLEVLEWAAGGQLEDDPAADYYVLKIPLAKPDLIEVVRKRGMRSVSWVSEFFGTEPDDAKFKPVLRARPRSATTGCPTRRATTLHAWIAATPT